MSQPPPKLRFSFQTKVLVPVLSALVLLPVATLWIVNRSMSQQVQVAARQTLTTAEGVFKNYLEIRSRDLASRFRTIVAEPRFKATAQLGDAKTLNNYLRALLDELRDETELIIYTTNREERLTSAQRNTAISLDDFERTAAPLIKQALAGEMGTGIISVGKKTFNVVSVPMQISENGPIIGAVTIAIRLSESSMQDLRALTRADIFLVTANAVTASTLQQPEASEILLREISRRTGEKADRVRPIEIQGEHFFALSDNYEPNGPGSALNYVLISSYEQRLRELEKTRATLLIVSFAGIVISGLLIWIMIRRITTPLLQLRDNAEAVGRGDFTRRMTRFSDDECGAVAVAFNNMTDNLQASRTDLEKAVTSLKTAQSQLIQSEKLSAVGQFVAGVAHELNNPLTSVIGFSDLLQHTDLDPKYKEYVDRIAKSATRCHKIVNSLLGFSRQHEPERNPVQVNELADAVIDIISYDLRSSGVTLVRQYQADLPAVLGDVHQLQQVVLNILSNARQALESFRRDGEITIRTSCTDTHVTIRIKDNGPGISRENLGKIFDPFFTTKPQGKGTGLGLSLSYGIMQEHGGRIRAESLPGEGTEFILELPAMESDRLAKAIRPPSAPSIHTGKPTTLRVLVIDDEVSILHLVKEVLSTEGHDVESATSGTLALELIGKNPYDVIISDWKMPGLNGMTFYQELLVKNPSAAKRVLFMTGDVIQENFQKFLVENSRTCLSKPFALREFRLAITRLMKPV